MCFVRATAPDALDRSSDSFWFRVAAALVISSGFFLSLNHLGHGDLTYWDESFHALVARNLLRHPLKPTLLEESYLPYDYRDWTENHIWLHKPILPLWGISASYAIFGVNTWALRLPSAVMAAGAVGLTVALGRRFFGRKAGLIAGALQAANAPLVSLVHGYQFSDHVDISLLFWVELGVYFLDRAGRSGSWKNVGVAGFAQGMAFLSKTYPAAIVSGLSVAAWLLPSLVPSMRGTWRLRFAHVAGLVAVTALTAGPWIGYCAIRYPQEFGHEQAYVFRHFSADLEGWGAPWDRLIFDYLIFGFREFYTPLLIAIMYGLPAALRRREPGPLLTYAWAAGVFIPFTIAETKTPMATVVGMPPCFLLLGSFIEDALVRRRVALSVLSGVLAMSLIISAVIEPPGQGYPDPHASGAIMQQSLWVVWHVIGALAVAVIVEQELALIRRLTSESAMALQRRALACAAVAALLTLFIRYAGATWRLTETGRENPSVVALSMYVNSSLPRNAVLIFVPPRGFDHHLTMMLTDHMCYRLRGRDLGGVAREIVARGGIPYVAGGTNTDLGPAPANVRMFGDLKLFLLPSSRDAVVPRVLEPSSPK